MEKENEEYEAKEATDRKKPVGGGGGSGSAKTPGASKAGSRGTGDGGAFPRVQNLSFRLLLTSG